MYKIESTIFDGILVGSSVQVRACSIFMLHKLHSLHTSLHSISKILTIECKEARNSRKLFLGLRAAETLHDYFCFDLLRRVEHRHTLSIATFSLFSSMKIKNAVRG